MPDQDDRRDESSLLPMLISGLILIVVGMAFVFWLV
jgi:hypothetical protein